MQTQLNWKAEDVIRVTSGCSLHEQNWTAHGISIDSRTTQKGDLFIALQGPQHDGHDYVASAFAAGASAAIVSHRPTLVPSYAPLVEVDDTFQALRALAEHGRARSKAKIIGITGSVGKTGTKEMVRLMLAAVGSVSASAGGLNNHWGLPLSLARLPQDVAYGVLEMGMNHAGELSDLSRLARPHIAMITTVEAVHLEFFKSVAEIADAKAEIFQGCEPGATAILNRDNPHYARLVHSAKTCGVKKILTFGKDPKADARLVQIIPEEQGMMITAQIMGHPQTFRLPVQGEHLAMNAVGALLTVAASGVDVETCAAALAQYRMPAGRGVQKIIPLADGDFTLIDDSYNASPVSMRAALSVLGKAPVFEGGRRIAILGDMRELGPASPALHADLADAIAAAGIDKVYCCGAFMRYLYDVLPEKSCGGWAPDSQGLAQIVATDIRTGDIVAVKGSLSMNMKAVISVLENKANTASLLKQTG